MMCIMGDGCVTSERYPVIHLYSTTVELLDTCSLVFNTVFGFPPCRGKNTASIGIREILEEFRIHAKFGGDKWCFKDETMKL